jgi:hypothetical protein
MLFAQYLYHITELAEPQDARFATRSIASVSCVDSPSSTLDLPSSTVQHCTAQQHDGSCAPPSLCLCTYEATIAVLSTLLRLTVQYAVA